MGKIRGKRWRWREDGVWVEFGRACRQLAAWFELREDCGLVAGHKDISSLGEVDALRQIKRCCLCARLRLLGHVNAPVWSRHLVVVVLAVALGMAHVRLLVLVASLVAVAHVCDGLARIGILTLVKVLLHPTLRVEAALVTEVLGLLVTHIVSWLWHKGLLLPKRWLELLAREVGGVRLESR